MAEIVQFLISQGHSWSEIKTYSPQTIGAFLVAAQRVRESDWRAATTGVWIGVHANYKALVEATKETVPKAEKREPTVAQQKAEWLKLSTALSGKLGL